MNKLTEIRNFTEIAKAAGTTRMYMKRKDVEYLISLLEEKDNALREIWQTEDLISGSTADAMRNRAYAALTSSNNGGDV